MVCASSFFVWPLSQGPKSSTTDNLMRMKLNCVLSVPETHTFSLSALCRNSRARLSTAYIIPLRLAKLLTEKLTTHFHQPPKCHPYLIKPPTYEIRTVLRLFHDGWNWWSKFKGRTVAGNKDIKTKTTTKYTASQLQKQQQKRDKQLLFFIS